MTTPEYAPRLYPDIVRDVLTTLTGGTVRESVVAPVDGPVVLDRLTDRPIRRVSHLDGLIDVGGTNVAIRFTEADFTLADLDGDGDLDAIVFRENGRKPVPGSRLTVNYYPAHIANPVPLTDLNVGSVVRTLLESVAREVALGEQYLQQIYRSAFLDTAEGSALDHVVALIGVNRLPAGYPLVKLRFGRQSANGGKVTLPAGTVVTDAEGNRYSTVSALTLEAGEESRSVLAAGLTAGMELLEAGAELSLETVTAGVSTVTNDEPGFRLSSGESDDALRHRSRGALHGTARGTLDALRFGLQSIEGVKSVEIQEFPNGMPGEVRIDIGYAGAEDEATAKAVRDRIEELRPAGIRVISGAVERRPVSAIVELTLAGTGVAGGELDEVTAGVEGRIAARLGDLPPGAVVRMNTLTAAALEDPRIADVTITFTDPRGGPIDTPVLNRGQVLDVVRPFAFAPPATERAETGSVATVADVDLTMPVHLQPGVSLADATAAIGLAVDGYLSGLGPAKPLTVDGLAAAIRDDTRFGLVRESVIVTVEYQGRFMQLADGQGSYLSAPGQRLRRRNFAVTEDGT